MLLSQFKCVTAYYLKITMVQGFVQQSESEQSKIRAKQTLQEWVSFLETLEDPRGKQY